MNPYRKIRLAIGLIAAVALMPKIPASADDFVVVSAQIVDSQTGDPLIGAYVTVEGQPQSRAISDINGQFSLSVVSKEGLSLSISYIGYKDKSVALSGLLPGSAIPLDVDAELLEEIVVVGYGTQKKVSSVGSIVQMTGESLEKSGSLTSVSEALQGKLNGVVAINSTGQPGANSTSIMIRGKSSWSSSSPLILVDGVERNMNDVDFNEIETISVLKDASATAVYGVRGGNGVILLTTKRGHSGKPTVSFSSNLSLKSPTSSVKFADYVTSMKMYNEACANDNAWDNMIPQSQIDAWQNAFDTGNYGPYNDVFPDVDWYDEMTKTALSRQYNLSVSGKTNSVRYFASVGYLFDDSIYKVVPQSDFDPSSYYQRLNWRGNFDIDVTKRTTLSLNISGKSSVRNQQYYSSFFQRLIFAPSNQFPIKYSDGFWGDYREQGANPMVDLSTSGQDQYRGFQGWFDVKLVHNMEYLTEGLKLRAQVTYDSNSTKLNRIVNGGFFSIDQNSVNSVPREFRTYDYTHPIIDNYGNLSYQIVDSQSGFHGNKNFQIPAAATYDAIQSLGNKIYYEFALDYNRKFRKHEVTALALMNRKIQDTNTGSSMDFPHYYENWVGRVTYNYSDRYLFEGNVSYTGSEKFAPGKRFGLFPSVSLGWRLTEEPWMKPVRKVLTDAKLRYSIGQVGNDYVQNRWQYIQMYTQQSGVNFGKDQNTLFGPTYIEGDAAQPDATWEVATKQNLALEFTLWKRLKVIAEAFDEKRDGILLPPKTTASWVGTSLSAANIGKTKNHGIELEVRWSDKIGANFNYYINCLFSTNENQIVFKDDPADLARYKKDSGKPIGWLQKYVVTGNYETIDDVFNGAQSTLGSNMVPGDFAYLDYNADGVINSNDMIEMESVNYPTTTFSVQMGFDWKNLGFSMMFYSPRGIMKNGIDAYLWDFCNGMLKAQPDTEDRWTGGTGSNDVVRPAIHRTQLHNNQDNTYKFSDYSYLRIKNIELRYKLPKKYLKNLNLSNASVFVSGDNIATWWKGDDRIDPETSSANVYPIVKTYTLGVRFSF